MVVTFIRGIGRLATDRYQFQQHIDGTGFRQKADTVDINAAPLSNLGNASTVEQALEYINTIGLGGGGGGGVTYPIDLSILGHTTNILPIVRGGTGLGAVGGANTVLTTNGSIMIWSSIVDANIASGAAITVSKISPGSNSQVLQTIGGVTSWGAAPAGTPGGSSGNIQFNNSGVFGGLVAVDAARGGTGLQTSDLTGNGLKVLQVNSGGTAWQLVSLPAGSFTPTGTGFRTVTSGVDDPAATANIRYAGGKLQTDVNIQYKNASITGDLAWAPTSSNKTLILPNASDTLVGKATTDIFTNKTLDVAGAGNLLISAAQATGDILKNNGTQFVRFPRGTANQVLSVNGGGTDLVWATPSTGSASSGAINTVQLSNGSGGFLGATNVLGGTNFISIGTSSLPISGTIRLQSGFDITSSNGVSDRILMYYDSNQDSIRIDGNEVGVAWGQNTVATTGRIRLPYIATDNIIAAKDSGGTDRQIIARVGADHYQFGPTTASSLNVDFRGNIVNLTSAAALTITGGTSTSMTSATTMSISGGSTAVINGATSTALQVGSSPYISLLSSTAQFTVPLQGVTSTPWRLGQISIDLSSATSPFTITAAQAAIPSHIFTGTRVSFCEVIYPANPGATYFITNQTNQGIGGAGEFSWNLTSTFSMILHEFSGVGYDSWKSGGNSGF